VRDLQNFSVLVTGGGSGLGEGIARHFAERGSLVTISGRREDKLRAVAESIGPRCAIAVGDIDVAADRQSMIDIAVAHGGGLDVLINNAGNMYRGPVTGLDEAKLRAIFGSNVIGPMLLTGLAVPHIAERGGGAVIFFGSVHNRRAYPGASPYAATRAATEGLTRVLAAELGPQKICVNCIVPGAVPTEINVRAGLYADAEASAARLEAMIPMHPLGRIGTPAVPSG
jgi:NAD(P)-dependent dehydrogenase (short-subunit alcohol dehydrogenase family)